MIRIYLIFLCLGIFSTVFCQLSLNQIATGFSNPVDIASPMDGTGRLFIVEQDGTIEVLDANYTNQGTYLDISSIVTSNIGELGLLGLTFDPDFSNNGYFYVYYSTGALPSTLRTVIERYQVDNASSFSPNIIEDSIIIEIPQFADNHNGGDLNFGPDGYLYSATGDGGLSNGPGDSSQLLTNFLGKVIRIDPNTLVPEIWHLGLRNPWRFSFDQVTGDLWIADVGQGSREEVNVLPASENVQGINYGWPCWEGSISCPGCNQNLDCGETIFPIYDYFQNNPRAVVSGFVLRGPNYSEFEGYYLFIDYYNNTMIGLNGSDTITFTTTSNISAFGQDENGKVYAMKRSGGGILYEVLDSSAVSECSAACYKVMNTNPSGAGSLTEAVSCANSGDTICFAFDLYRDTITLNSTIQIENDIVINALKSLSVYIDGRNLTNAIVVNPGVTCSIFGLKIMGQNSSNGAIYNQGNLTVENAVIYGDGSPGSIFVNEGELVLRNNISIEINSN